MRDDLPALVVHALARAKTPAERAQLEAQYRALRAARAAQRPAPAPVPVPPPPPAPAPARARASKRHIVAKLPADWRARVFAATDSGRAPSRLRQAVALLWLTGCRPAEIEKGVDVSILGQYLVVKISGAKCGVIDNGSTQALRGIETRILAISAGLNPAAEMLYSLATAAGGKMRVEYDSVALSNKVAAAGKKALKKSGVSPYCFRHAMGSDLKSCDGLDDAFKAQVMGHLSVESLARYGRRRRGGGGPSPIQRVRASADPRGVRAVPGTPAPEALAARPRP